MIKAVLLDLDDTLLHIDTDAFVRNYLDALMVFVSGRYPTLAQDTIKRAMRNAARATIANLEPAQFNATVMNAAVAEVTQIPVDEMNVVMAEFFATEYVSLGHTAAPIDGAAALIEQLLALGLTVVVATNPIFPKVAIEGRLAWAGLDPQTLPISFVTTLDNMHFAKPHPHYYEEILARIGIEADDALMVGDSLENDMIPAAAAGLSTFWIAMNRALPDTVMPDGAGTLLDLSRCIREGWLQTLQARPRTPAQVAPRMLGNLGALFGLVAEMDPLLWNVHPDAQEWSPLELICHLRDSEQTVQRPRLLRILQEDNPFIAQPPPPFGPGERDLSDEDGNAALHEFAAERAKTLDFLAGLGSSDWERPARHSIFGPTSLLEMVHFTARHDRLHISQLCQTIGRCQTS